ncbi:hypothetical protein J4S47_004738 [Salmonella enterica]|nr:hypothetical protein [Salmonella enterica]EJI4683809.1 hypothetical protein [Salmonella enterica]ELQ3569291.1 hypothetical protein [Salmonella enterica]
MKIQERDGDIVDIYSIYWINNKTLFLGFPKGYGGLRAYDLATVTVIDPSLTGEFFFYEDAIYHWALIKEKLLDDIIERDEVAYKRFLEILKSEGHVDEDFY